MLKQKFPEFREDALVVAAVSQLAEKIGNHLKD
jgi:hypothetical protein